ncbi:MAG: DUF86 domain-containing protein [Deltaproteobacteria bacterium]|nr:DUF86 domain-containing protein [Deltaproteobacteria bacterium]
MTKTPLIYLDDILESIQVILEYTEDLSKEEFLTSMKDQDAIIRRFIVIGEAVARLSSEFKAKYPEIPWHQMYGMRNHIIHGYEAINLDTIWDTSKNLLPRLRPQIEEIIAKE